MILFIDLLTYLLTNVRCLQSAVRDILARHVSITATAHDQRLVIEWLVTVQLAVLTVAGASAVSLVTKIYSIFICCFFAHLINMFSHSFISGMHHYECITPSENISLQSGRFWTKSIASFRERSNDFKSCGIVFIHVVWGHPGGFLQFSRGGSC